MRDDIENIVKILRDKGDSHIFYRSGLELFGPGDTDNLPDGLHPDAEGQHTLGRRFAKAEFGAAGRVLPGRVSEGNL